MRAVTQWLFIGHDNHGQMMTLVDKWGRAERGPVLFIVLGLSMVLWRAGGDEAAVS